MTENLKRKIIKLFRLVKNKVNPPKELSFNKTISSIRVIVSHSDYLNSMGGTEKYIYEQIQHIRKKTDQDVIQIFPLERGRLFDDRKRSYGVNFNENFVGYYDINTIIRDLRCYSELIDDVDVHHLIYWKESDFTNLLSYLRKWSLNICLYIHDFFPFTPSVYEIYTNSKITLKEVYTSNAEYMMNDPLSNSKELEQWQGYFSKIIGIVDEIIVPSDFIRRVSENVYPFIKSKITVRGHLKLIEGRKKESSIRNRKIRVAYLGYMSKLKGWNTWTELINNNEINNCYDLYHLGCGENYSENVHCEKYSFIDNGIMAAVDVLNKHEIDIVILWSMVPESYSYTFYEAIAGGIPVITSTRSGNIACEVERKGKEYGIVLESDHDLEEFLKDTLSVSQLISKKRNMYELEYNYKD